jgi:hypothetical protein
LSQKDSSHQKTILLHDARDSLEVALTAGRPLACTYVITHLCIQLLANTLEIDLLCGRRTGILCGPAVSDPVRTSTGLTSRPLWPPCFPPTGSPRFIADASGVIVGLKAPEIFVRREKAFEPDAKRHAVHRERLAKYQELFPHDVSILEETIEGYPWTKISLQLPLGEMENPSALF